MKVSISNNVITQKGHEKDISFKRIECTIEEFFNFVINGYAYTSVFNKEVFHISEKTKANWRGTEFVSFDFDDVDVEITLSQFIDSLAIKPTMAYTTHNHRKIKHEGEEPKARFRLIYVLDKEVTNENEYKSIYQAIADKLGIIDDDKTALQVERFFYGNNESEEVYINAQNILNVESLDLKPFIIPTKEKVTKTPNKAIKQTISKELNQLIESNDFTELFFILTKERGNRVITESNVIYNNKGYADLNDEYIELQRVFENGKPKIYNDGELRHRKLFEWLIIRKQIKPNITMEELLTNAIFDLQHFINNADGKFTKSLLLNITQSAYNHPITIKKKDNKKTFKIDKTYCQTHNITAKGMVGIVRRLKNNESIEEWYDISKSVKENLNYAKENNIKVSQKTLYRFCDRNGINTKGEKKEPTPTLKEESTQEKPIYELNNEPLTPQEIEETIKNTYKSLEEFEDNFEDIKDNCKTILEKERVSNYSNKWLELLKHYQALKITA